MKFTSKTALSLAAAVLLSTSCNKVPGQGKDDSSNSGSDTSSAPPATGEASTVTMSGALALTVDDGSALNLTAATYNLYCVTFEEEPKACKGDIAGDGNFGFGCEGFVGRAFGCFLRDGVKTLGSIEFDDDSSLVAGAGDLVFNMVFNPETGSIKATIDHEKSSSLSEEALAAFKGFLEKNKTVMADLTGNWEIKPDCAKNPDFCPDEIKNGDASFPVYMEQYTRADGQNFLAMWSNETKKNQCGGSNALSFTIAGAAIDFKSKESLFEGLRQAMGSVDAGLRAKIKELAIARGKKQYGWCENNNNNPFTADNCKLVKPEIVTNTWKDEKGNEITNSYPKFYSVEEFDSIPEATGDSVVDVSCSFEWKEGIPGCPPNATKNADGTGSFKQAMSGGVGMMLVCKDPNNSNNLMNQPAAAVNEADSIAAVGAKKPPECDVIADGEFKGAYRASAHEAARALLDMARINPEDNWAQEMCNRYTIDPAFSWSQCLGGGGGGNTPSVCWDSWLREGLGLTIDTSGKLVAGGPAPKENWFNGNDYLEVCPTAANAAIAAQSTQNYDGATYKSQCQAAVLKLTAVQQATAFSKVSQQWQPLGEVLYCDPNFKAAVTALSQGSCMADARLDHQCGPNGCEEVLMCSGSSANGRCYDDAGNFAGRVSGRDDNMMLKMGIAGSFSMTQSEQEFWRRFDPTTNEQQKCIFSRISTMNNLKIDDNSFSGIYTSNQKEKCEVESKEGMALVEGEGGEGGGGEGGGDEGGGGSMTIPFTATRK